MFDKIKNIKIDPAKLLTFGVVVLGVVQAVLQPRVDKANVDALKSEIKDEILQDIKNS